MKYDLKKNFLETKEEYHEALQIFFRFLKNKKVFYYFMNNIHKYNYHLNKQLIECFMNRNIPFDMFLLSSFDITNDKFTQYISVTKWREIDDEWVEYLESLGVKW